jgi:hypothetical protein
MHDTDPQYTPCTIPVDSVMTLLNTIEPILTKIKLIGDVSPLVDEAPIKDRGRVAIGLLESVSDYTAQLEGALTLFSNQLPRCQQGE